VKMLIVSDMHLGSKASTADGRLDALARLAPRFDRVIFNGDTLDRYYSTPPSDEKAQHYLDSIKARCGGRNGPPELLTGNHDPAVGDAHWIYHEASETLVFHGDCLADCTHPSKAEEQEMMAHFRVRWDALGGRPVEFEALHQNYREVQRQWLPVINPYKKSKTAWQYAKSLLFPPRRPFDILNYWRTAPRKALKVARGFQKPLKHVVFGHTHRPGHWRMEGIEVFNTGSFMPFSKPFAITLEDEKVGYVALDQLLEAVPRTFAGFSSRLQS
jgi:UDP-2,3-diacylglucosamine pyrophosphatase LpxH